MYVYASIVFVPNVYSFYSKSLFIHSVNEVELLNHIFNLILE